MWWKLGGLATLAALLTFIIAAPLFSLRVTGSMPPGVVPPPPQQVQTVGSGIMIVAGLIAITLILGLAIWLARRILRRQRS